MFGTKDVQGPQPQFPGRLDPGIHDVKIISIVSGESTQKKTPYVEFLFGDGIGQHRATFYFAPGESTRISLEKIKHLGSKIIGEAAIDAISANSTAEYAQKLDQALTGKNVRIKLSGKEQVNTKTNKQYVERFFNYYPWAESADVPRAETKLRFDKTKMADYKLLASASEATSDMDELNTAPAPVDDLPF